MANIHHVRKAVVYFIGAGPGAVDLITVRGRDIIERADVIIYAGSLVNKELFADVTAPVYDSSGMNLDEIIEIIKKTAHSGGVVARVHTGDPSLYGAIKEQMARLDAEKIAYEVVPGVSSAFGAAAALGVELTLPEVTQSVIITRRGGRTPVPDKERLEALARHQSTMMIFLSVGMMRDVVDELTTGGYLPNTPAVVVYRATWEDEEIVAGTLENIAEKVENAGIKSTAMICVGPVFGNTPLKSESRLYNKYFSHGSRKGLDQ